MPPLSSLSILPIHIPRAALAVIALIAARKFSSRAQTLSGGLVWLRLAEHVGEKSAADRHT
jgi:hypothetical protein